MIGRRLLVANIVECWLLAVKQMPINIMVKDRILIATLYRVSNVGDQSADYYFVLLKFIYTNFAIT